MKTRDLVPIPVTLGKKKIGTLLVSAELADDIRFNPNFPTEPELPNDDDRDEFLRNGLQE